MIKLISILMVTFFVSMAFAKSDQRVRVEQVNPTIVSVGYIENGVCVIPKGVDK